jgi:2-oxoisovalerate dehydrogenase E2 component (dihydrolipoyl transacylase)
MKSKPKQETGTSEADVHRKPTQATISQEDKIVKIEGNQAKLAKTMTDTTFVTHYNLQEEVAIEKLKNLIKDFNTANPDKKIGYMPFVMKVFSHVLLEYPMFNGLVSPKLDSQGFITEYTERADHNFGITIDTPQGLVVPCIRQIQNKSVFQINDELINLTQKAKADKLSAEDCSDATYTVSDLDELKVMSGVPRIFNNQISIGAIGKARVVPELFKQPNGEWGVRPKEVLALSVSCDHRIVDGATGARFCTRIKNVMENIESLMFNLK